MSEPAQEKPKPVRVGLTETVNAYRDMPASVDALEELEGRLDDVRAANVEHHVGLLRKAKAAGAEIVGLGELFTGPYFALTQIDMWRELAEDAWTGPTVTRLREVCRELGLIVIAPIYELTPEGRRFNTAVLIDEHGEVIGRYRKTHIPHGENDKGVFLERFYYDEADGDPNCGPANIGTNPYFPVFQTSQGKIGIAICYDRHFPGVVWSLALGGAELIFSPAVTFGTKSQRMWHLEFPTDATRHHVFIAGSNRKGSEPPWNQPYFGESYVVGPHGVAPDLSDDPELVIADVDLSEIRAKDPAGWDFPRDTRAGIYSVAKVVHMPGAHEGTPVGPRALEKLHFDPRGLDPGPTAPLRRGEDEPAASTEPDASG